MKGTIVLSHGLESGPHATKVSALAEVAEQLGWASVRPDYRDLDNTRDLKMIAARTQRAIDAAPGDGRIVFAGSSMGALISGFASLKRDCEALFLLALPVGIPNYPVTFDAARVPTVLVHGWHDELCPVAAAIDFARGRSDTLHLVNDDHRLGAHVQYCADAFRQLLLRLES